MYCFQVTPTFNRSASGFDFTLDPLISENTKDPNVMSLNLIVIKYSGD